MIQEFKTFIMRGSVIDLAVGVIMGGAFGKIVNSLVADIIMPPIGLVIGQVNFKDLKIIIGGTAEAPVTWNYGNFIQVVVEFLIIAFAIFMVIKAINTLKKKEEAKPTPEPQPSPQEKLLMEIRDLLKK
ncbi:MAG: large-conductance mechanosensitive channel protein MscL [Flammeovirgaceae bacterium]|nr:large-conductance mechanosensitive channel protein MscL [Flammeovirgaceae bacterium]MDW8287939.1 large-conductance mechanosensitive channel protein MscL [Flammeovirgaceae bacterium]